MLTANAHIRALLLVACVCPNISEGPSEAAWLQSDQLWLPSCHTSSFIYIKKNYKLVSTQLLGDIRDLLDRVGGLWGRASTQAARFTGFIHCIAAERRKVPGSQIKHFTDTWVEKWKWWILWCGSKPECWNKCPQMEWQELLTGSWTSCDSAEGTVFKSESGWWQWQFTKGCGRFAALETSETACLFFCERCSCSNRN